jgi:hypothetical protein
VFIPAGGTWVSVEENVLTHPVKGIIYAARTDPDAHFIPDAQTGCV